MLNSLKRKFNWFIAKLQYSFTDEYRIYRHPIYINLRFWRLFKYRNKAKYKYVKPKFVFYKGATDRPEYKYYMESPSSFENKLFGLHIEPVGYKYKWRILEYIYCPEIVCVFNKKILFTIRLEAPDTDYYEDKEDFKKSANLLYWENVLKYVFSDNGRFYIPTKIYKRFSEGDVANNVYTDAPFWKDF